MGKNNKFKDMQELTEVDWNKFKKNPYPKKRTLTKTTYKMKEQDLIENMLDAWNKKDSLQQCVKVAENYAREESIGFLEWKDKLYVEQKAGLFDLGNGIININELKNVSSSELYEIYLTTKTQNK